jgi:hypothetical protein
VLSRIQLSRHHTQLKIETAANSTARIWISLARRMRGPP